MWLLPYDTLCHENKPNTTYIKVFYRVFACRCPFSTWVFTYDWISFMGLSMPPIHKIAFKRGYAVKTTWSDITQLVKPIIKLVKIGSGKGLHTALLKMQTEKINNIPCLTSKLSGRANLNCVDDNIKLQKMLIVHIVK